MTTPTAAPVRTPPQGTGYGHPRPTYNTQLTHVGPGTPMGEYMRRYWHPIAVGAEIKDLPQRARILGEDLVVFRDKRGRIGVVFERCAHRQASLFFGRIEEEGIRCCYHGWLFDVEGRCLDQAVEEGGGRHRDKVRQPWYPAEERYGLVFVYMGPPDKMPRLPRYDFMEPLAEGEFYAAAFDSLPGATSKVLPTNWLIDQDNIHDMGHAMWLHHLHSGPQFGPAFAYVTKENAAFHQAAYDYVETPRGMYSTTDLAMPWGVVTSVLETQMPNVRIIHPPHIPGKAQFINWCVPADDFSHFNITLVRVKPGAEMVANPMADWDRSDPEVVQRQPSDNEAQNSQGPIEFHSEEHLASSDRGVVKLRRQYHRQLEALAKGEPLMNLAYEPGSEVFGTEAGAFAKAPAG